MSSGSWPKSTFSPGADKARRRIAEEIDARNAAEEKAHFRQEFCARYKRQQNSDFREDITSGSTEFIKKYNEFKAKLKNDTVLNVVKNNLLEEHLLLFIPSSQDDEVQKTQLEHTKLYKESLAIGGRFHDAYDNLATKLTLLFFGWPIEPVSKTNIANCDKDDTNDDPDPEESPPRVQKVYYTEKPLEFLNKYNERSYGYPILRSK
jgi:hypothetical protein